MDNPEKSLPKANRLIVDEEDGGLLKQYQVWDLPDPMDLLPLKPKNCGWSDEKWVSFASFSDVTTSWRNAWKDFYKENEVHWGPNEMLGALFGKLGTEIEKAVNLRLSQSEIGKDESWPLIKLGLLSRALDANLEDLGWFGQWFEGSGIDRKHLVSILKSYLDS